MQINYQQQCEIITKYYLQFHKALWYTNTQPLRCVKGSMYRSDNKRNEIIHNICQKETLSQNQALTKHKCRVVDGTRQHSGYVHGVDEGNKSRGGTAGRRLASGPTTPQQEAGLRADPVSDPSALKRSSKGMQLSRMRLQNFRL